MAKTPSTSRKSLSKSAPYKRSAPAEPAAPAPPPVPLPEPVAAPELLAPLPLAPALLLHPSDIVTGDPTAPAPPPGPAPHGGDSRSLRHLDQFALVYRVGASLVTHKGNLGTRGFHRVVDYPSPSQAAAAYATECSRLLSLGFVDHVG